MRLCVSCGHTLRGSDWACERCGWSAPAQDGIPQLSRLQGAQAAKFSPQDFECLYALEHDYFWFRGRIRLILWAFERYANGCRSFLEIGCGTGSVLAALVRAHPDISVWGSEPYLEGLRFARTRVDSARLVQMDARCVPFADEFDAIGMFDVIEHIDEDQAVLSQVSRALRPGGILLITVPQHRFLWSPADEHAGHARRYTRAELVQKVEHAQFRVLRCTSFVSLLFPLLLISRFRRKGREYDPHAEYRVPRVVNAVLEMALSAERTAIRLGATLPFGGSLLLVARREGGGAQ
ncbi:MAG TPA: class I SAM-dependent methyltransferase [Burkholderiales bacterium]|nr:class I SAM-dependent methyltransferase [Burkholderiales bacterium]